MKKDLNKKDLQKFVTGNHLSLGDLRKFLENHLSLPDNTPIVIERIEDKYFLGDTRAWQTYKQPNDLFIHEQDEFIPAWCITKNNEDVILIYSHY